MALFSVARTSAFLLPPDISAADIIKLSFEDAVAMDGHVVEINCPGCPVTTVIDGKTLYASVESMLQLNFTISHEGADQLSLNGLQIYPLEFQADAFMEPLRASQMVKSPDNTWHYASTPQLGYSLSVQHQATGTNDQIKLVSINVGILEVADEFLSGIPSVDIKLLETPTGQLMIGDAQIVAPKSSTSTPTDEGQECTTIICKWKAIVASKLSDMKKCGSKARPGAIQMLGSKPHHGKHHGDHNGHRRPRPHGSHQSSRHHHKNGLARFFRGIVLHVFIPLLIGCMVGIAASLIGMVVGHTAIFAWRLLFRRGQNQRYTRVLQSDVAVVDDEENKKSLESQAPPPVYSDVVVDEKSLK